MSTAPQLRTKAVSAVKLVSVDCGGELDDGELLTGTVTVTDPSGAPASSNAAVSTAALTINGRSVPAGAAVQFLLAVGGTAGTTYRYSFSVATDSSPAQTIIGCVALQVTADCPS